MCISVPRNTVAVNSRLHQDMTRSVSRSHSYELLRLVVKLPNPARARRSPTVMPEIETKGRAQSHLRLPITSAASVNTGHVYPTRNSIRRSPAVKRHSLSRFAVILWGVSSTSPDPTATRPEMPRTCVTRYSHVREEACNPTTSRGVPEVDVFPACLPFTDPSSASASEHSHYITPPLCLTFASCSTPTPSGSVAPVPVQRSRSLGPVGTGGERWVRQDKAGSGTEALL
jgi:hypothetical protein